MQFGKGAFLGLLLLALVAAMPVAHGVAAADDPATVLQRFNDARNRGDIDGAAALLTDDVRYAEGPYCTADNPCIGVAAARATMEDGKRIHVQGTVVGTPVVTGTTVRFRAEIRFDNIPVPGVERLIVNGTVDVRDGKIASYIDVPDLSDAQTAQLLAAQPPPQSPPGMTVVPNAVPRTGGGYGASIIRRLGDG